MGENMEKSKVPTHKKCWSKVCGHRPDKHGCICSAFPRNPERCKAWLKVVEVKDYVSLPISPSAKYYEFKQVFI
ncbi:hypothetical protein PV327_011719 [Microctonus hyperodae]|uniref:Uncharacterized protein n=1 Tax=Microctonus hyperodae TaxID=165561 RepID=A0AA39KPJ9_MICHY|nr:hypothetical protein PV327_011719 [Microctonus hyperodae]